MSGTEDSFSCPHRGFNWLELDGFFAPPNVQNAIDCMNIEGESSSGNKW